MLLVLGSCTSFQFGAALATHLFPVTSAVGATLLRLGLAAIVLLAVTRPPVRGWSRAQWRSVIIFGVSLAGMNGFYYAALARLPLSAAVMTAGALVLLPFGAMGAWHAAGRPGPMPLAFGVAMLASVVPYTLEFAAMRRAPRRVFGILLSLDPALATLAGWLLLGQRSSAIAIAAVAVVITASVGSTVTAGGTRGSS